MEKSLYGTPSMLSLTGIPAKGDADIFSIPEYICTLSQFIIAPFIRMASLWAKSDLPDAVGPVIIIAVCFIRLIIKPHDTFARNNQQKIQIVFVRFFMIKYVHKAKEKI